MELAIGTYLNNGKYRIEKVLGQGSFGITYLATAKFTINGNLGKVVVEAKVAIKEFFMSDVNSRKADGSTVEGSNGFVFSNYRNKFRKEADNLRKLDCPGIVKVYDVFDENGTTYYSMEYLDGGNLDEYISKNNPIDESEAISIIRDVCNALALMHDKRMLHLDLKPKNIMRTSDGKICLIDFGLSKQFTANGEPESTTSIGQGTPGYAPLEQAKFIKDGSFPATLDVYALGATMYKILTGVRPLEASDILNEGFPKEPLVRNKRSESLIGIVEKCMSPMKKDRFQNIRDIVLPVVESRITVNVDESEASDEKTEINILRKSKKKQKRHNVSSIEPNKVEGTSKINITTDIDNYDSEQKSSFIHRISEDSSGWKDLKLTVKYVVIGIGIILGLITIFMRNSKKESDTVQNRKDYLQYYQPNTEFTDSIIVEVGQETMNVDSSKY